MRGRRWLALPATLALTLAFAGSASAEEVVNDDTDGPGACATPGHATVQAGVNAAAADETVTVCPGTYNETVTIPNGADGLTIDGATGQPMIADGIVFGSPNTDITFSDIHVQPGAANFVISGAVTNLTMDNVMVDGDNVAGKHGVGSGQINGVVDVHDSQFVDIPNWATFDTRSGSGGATQGADLTTFNFSDNYLSNNGGHVNARGTIGDNTTLVTMANNTVENYPDVPANNSASVFKVFYANALDFTGNDISSIGTLQASIGGFPYGAGLMPRNVVDLEVTGNSFDDSVQGIAFEPRNATSGGFPDGVIAGGTISENHFDGNDQGIFVTATNHPTSNLGALEIHGNRFAGNGQAIDNDSGTSLDAENNWWGCNAGPGSAGCDPNGGTVDSDPRLVLNLSANPTSIATGGATSQLTADIGKNSAGQAFATNLFDGEDVVFGTSLGTVQSPRTIAGTTATSTLTSGATAGTANASATLDSQTSGAQVTFVGPPAPQEPQPEPEPPLPAPLPGPTDGADTLIGTDGDDEISGLGGEDSILGGLGDDLIKGGGAADVLDGGEGKDEVGGGKGADTVDGGEGNDVLRGGPGRDTLDGGPGKDDVAGNRGQDEIVADDGDKDTINCGANVDTVVADNKDDVSSNCENVS